MLTRIRISGFKNLVDVEVRFGPFTCIAGPNAVGKSNLFDAIRLLSALADRPLLDAALSVRGDSRAPDLRALFNRSAGTQADRMSFEAEMIVPAEGHDDLGQPARAGATFLRYSVEIGFRKGDSPRLEGPLELLSEELVPIPLRDVARQLGFLHGAAWRGSMLRGGRRSRPFISTVENGARRIIRQHAERGSGRPLDRSASDLPRTVLSVANAAESPTALLARREMMSWRVLRLEPSALRRPDEFTAPPRLGTDGSHLAATVYHLARSRQPERGESAEAAEARFYGEMALRLSDLTAGVREVGVDRDEKRELLTLWVTGRDGTAHPARSLSDGALRFLALTALYLDFQASGVWCLEEPENGIHPERVPALLELLQEIVTDVREPIGPDNPARQIIINTHSPAVVAAVPSASLILAESEEAYGDQGWFQRVCFRGLPDTWRHLEPGTPRPAARGRLLAYLNPIRPPNASDRDVPGDKTAPRLKNLPATADRVVDRADLHLMLPTAPPTDD